MSNYLAVIRHNGIGSWARCAERKDAITSVTRIFQLDWSKFLGLKRGQEIQAQVINVQDYDDISWGDQYWFANRDGTKGTIPAEMIETVTVKLP